MYKGHGAGQKGYIYLVDKYEVPLCKAIYVIMQKCQI